ncbi:enoyl-CoA hydratase/isomerase family protein [Aldersonia sp. NBC_00410]|uniref:enoyl-CoA hydratase/isomerase family protein n=1 Tax=Aldersonia sp. NBC_00410 TaxID=2975954 RepID=UPI00224CAF7E|nr:enoyl-CoA hydratase/isomerase family protein [Aldersonia sp. NBC_00410]MCX5044180.1 enoyl-CoA hydratase/isomerase family protein [Aldersonia sp. NBC_00410]
MKPRGLADVAAGCASLSVGDTMIPDEPLVVVDLDRDEWAHLDDAVAALRNRTVVVVGIANQPLPEQAAPLLESLACTLAPSGPGRTWVTGGREDLGAITDTVGAAPRASLALTSLLDLTTATDVENGLVAESLAYSMLLAGPEFAQWRRSTPRRPVPDCIEPVLLDRDGDELTVTLNRPERHNAFARQVRDGVIEAMAVAEYDPSITRVVLRGNGRSFCSGGDLDEFGTATDVAAAHLVRLQRSAGLAVHRIAERVRAVVHGSCIGAGIEVPAFAGQILAHDDATFRLPELTMGLVPGAGGTVSIPRRIGKWRTAFLALTARPVGAETALEWGLVDGRT